MAFILFALAHTMNGGVRNSIHADVPDSNGDRPKDHVLTQHYGHGGALQKCRAWNTHEIKRRYKHTGPGEDDVEYIKGSAVTRTVITNERADPDCLDDKKTATAVAATATAKARPTATPRVEYGKWFYYEARCISGNLYYTKRNREIRTYFPNGYNYSSSYQYQDGRWLKRYGCARDTPRPTRTPTLTPTPTHTPIPTLTPTPTVWPWHDHPDCQEHRHHAGEIPSRHLHRDSDTLTEDCLHTPTPSPTPAVTPTVDPLATPTPTPTVTPTPTQTSTPNPRATATPTPTPTPTPPRSRPGPHGNPTPLTWTELITGPWIYGDYYIDLIICETGYNSRTRTDTTIYSDGSTSREIIIERNGPYQVTTIVGCATPLPTFTPGPAATPYMLTTPGPNAGSIIYCRLVSPGCEQCWVEIITPTPTRTRRPVSRVPLSDGAAREG